MTLSTTTIAADLARTPGFGGSINGQTGTISSVVSWGAIVAGAAAASSISLILLILGVGLGLSSVSPWALEGVSATTFGVSTIVWLTFTQLLASAMGGYLAGRLRTKWADAPNDEVFFRDTAHGFLAWAVASLATAALLTSLIGSLINGVQAGSQVVGGVASTASSAVSDATASARIAQGQESGPMRYFVDSLFRRDDATALPNTGAAGLRAGTDANDHAFAIGAAEVGRIFLNVSLSEPLPEEDIRYVGQIVAQRTGLSQQGAQDRVAEVYARVQAKVRDAEAASRDATDMARKASASSALWLFVSLLVGAFVASLAATFGGRRRDA